MASRHRSVDEDAKSRATPATEPVLTAPAVCQDAAQNADELLWEWELEEVR